VVALSDPLVDGVTLYLSVGGGGGSGSTLHVCVMLVGPPCRLVFGCAVRDVGQTQAVLNAGGDPPTLLLLRNSSSAPHSPPPPPPAAASFFSHSVYPVLVRKPRRRYDWDFKRSISAKLQSADFFSEPSQTSLACVASPEGVGGCTC
jgi:hypothetical protein